MTVSRSQRNANPYPEKWTLVCSAFQDNHADPYDTEDEARGAFQRHVSELGKRAASIASAYVIPPDGEGEIIVLVGSAPAMTATV